MYIGQSRQIEKRFQQHKAKAKFLEEDKWYNPLYIDMYSIGIDSFSFEVIEECSIEDLNEREECWIKYYNSQDDGYNITSGGDCTGKLSSDDVNDIIHILNEKVVSIDDIANKYHVSCVTIRAINRGEEFCQDSIQYPIRIYEDNLSIYLFNANKNRHKDNYCIDCGKKIDYSAIRCIKCNHIRQRKVKDRPSKEELSELIKTKSFLEIGRIYGVSDNAIRKWCKLYGLPYRSKDIKKIL